MSLIKRINGFNYPIKAILNLFPSFQLTPYHQKNLCPHNVKSVITKIKIILCVKNLIFVQLITE